MAEQKHVVSVGQATIELARGKDGRFALSSGGDTFNTAIYLARAGHNVAFASAVGDDPYSDGIVALATVEGVATDWILRAPGRLPALSLIETTRTGERQELSWSDTAPARDLFELPDWSRIAEVMIAARLIYFSGVTLSLYSNVGLGRFLATLEFARQQGTKIAFDGNFRLRGWNGEINRARTVMMEALKRVDLALPSYDDEAVLWGDRSPEATVERLRAFGVPEIVVSNGANNAVIASAKETLQVPVPEVIEPVDATAAGDGFSAGYLAARLAGDAPQAAAEAGHRLARDVIRHVGPLTPRAGAAVH
jgi:2-dehydro-3-deoxygluconokinase